MNTEPAAPADYSSETLIQEWERVPGHRSTYRGRDGWVITKYAPKATLTRVVVTSNHSWITLRPDGTVVCDRSGRAVGYASALSAQLAASRLIAAAAATR